MMIFIHVIFSFCSFPVTEDAESSAMCYFTPSQSLVMINANENKELLVKQWREEESDKTW